MKTHKTLILCNLMILLLLYVILSPCNLINAQSWVLSKKVGKWEKTEITNIETKKGAETCELEFKATNVTLGAYETTFVIDLQGSGVITGELTLEIIELGFKIRYLERYKPAALWIGEEIHNELEIIVDGERKVFVNQSAKWPYQTRLNERLYIWIWRSSNDKLTWVITDGYMQKTNGQLYYTGNITYYGEPLTMLLKAKKIVENGEGKLTANLIYNEIDSTGELHEKYELKTMDYGFNAFFYASLSLSLIHI